MQVMMSLFLALAQLVVFGAAVPLAMTTTTAPPSPVELGQLILLQAPPAQAQLDDSSAGPALLPSAPSDTSAPSTSSSSGGTMRVQMDMFSGRPNPSWDISSSEADQVRGAFRQLPERQAGSRTERLGYRGLIVQGDGVRDLGLTRMLIGGGIVIAEGIQGVRYYSDSDRGLERLVFQTGRSRLDPTDYAAFKSIAFP